MPPSEQRKSTSPSDRSKGPLRRAFLFPPPTRSASRNSTIRDLEQWGYERVGHEPVLCTTCFDVAQALGPHATALELSTAVLHDVLEDTDWTKDELAEAGIEDTILEAVETLTRRAHEEHENFVARICTTPGVVGVTAQRVKLADLSVNLAHANSEEERERLERSIPIVRSALERNRASV